MFISVIVCTYNREKHIRRALESLVQQDFDIQAYEIIVVDNCSTDNTYEIIHQFKNDFPQNKIKILTENRQGLSFARNAGIENAEGNYISFIDDDAIARRDYLSQIKFYTQKYPQNYAFGGKVLPRYENGKEPEWMSPYIERIISIVDLGNKEKVFKKSYPVGCNMIFKKEIFEKVGKFNTDLRLRSDDKYIFQKIKKAGYKVLYLPRVVVEHFIDDYRTHLPYIRRISRLNGKAENIRLNSLKEGRTKEKILRFFDYVFKINAAFLLWIFYFFRGTPQKGKMLCLSLINQFLGFVKPASVKEY